MTGDEKEAALKENFDLSKLNKADLLAVAEYSRAHFILGKRQYERSEQQRMELERRLKEQREDFAHFKAELETLRRERDEMKVDQKEVWRLQGVLDGLVRAGKLEPEQPAPYHPEPWRG